MSEKEKKNQPTKATNLARELPKPPSKPPVSETTNKPTSDGSKKKK